MPAVDLVVTDLDGTLWRTDDHVAPSVVAAFAELEPRGLPVLVATGRRTASTRAPLARVGLAPPAVLLNGALGLDLVEVHLDRSLDYPGFASLTAAPKGQSKWDGVTAFCAARGLDAGRVLALADGPNDIELLTHAAVRLVPAMAHPAALDLADHVIPAAADGGWAAVLDHLG